MPAESERGGLPEGLCWIPIQGDSMWPSLRAGDVAGVEPLKDEACPGEVVLARFPQALVVHRVRRWARGVCVLRGDNVPAEDPPVARAQVLGRVRGVRRGGVVLNAARWDVGPQRRGYWRVVVKRGLAALLGRRRR